MRNVSAVGLDVHARTIHACALIEATGELRRARFGPDRQEVIDWLRLLPGPVRTTYEAGPTGYVLARELTAAGFACLVCAPGKIPRAPGDRVKTDTRDAERLARLLRLDELTAVRIPANAEEAARDLVRAREDTRGDLMRARHRLSKFLLRHGYLYDGSAWTRAHDEWTRRATFTEPAAERAFAHYHEVQLDTRRRRDLLDAEIGRVAIDPLFSDTVARLRAIRGISTLSALALCVEIGDWHRFSGATIAAFLGLVPSESSSGEKTSRGHITKTGNGYARRLLVEAAWQQRRPLRASRALTKRRTGLDPLLIDRAERCQRRLHSRWQRLEMNRGKRSTVVAVAVARELAGWCWSIATMPV